MQYLIIIFLSLSLVADSNISENFYNEYEQYRLDITNSMYQYSNAIDQYLSDDNSSNINVDEQKTSIEVAPFVAFEDKRDPEYRFKVHASLKLPRTLHKLNLSFEDYSNSDSIDDMGSKTNPNSDNNYLLGLEFRSNKKAFSSFRFGGGVKFNNAIPDPYFSIKIQKQFDVNEWRVTASNRFRYFVKNHVDNRIELNFGYFLNEETKLQFLNSYRYKDEESTHEVTHILRVHNLISQKKNIYADINIYRLKNETTPLSVNYYKIGFRYHKDLYKDWLYYEAAPALMFRIENDYAPTARIFLTLGLIFGESKTRSTDRFYSNF